jgi:hypothetical protein
MNSTTKHDRLSPERDGFDSDLDEDMHDDDKQMALKADGNASSDNATNSQDKSSLKEASRPRRKKARRACHACQRAHLTCGMFVVLLLDP